MTATTSFTDRMHQHLMDVKVSVDGTVADIESAGSRAGATLRTRRDEAEVTMQARRKEIDEANARLKADVQAKKATADSAVAEWKAKQDVNSLEARADLAEDLASAAVVVAWGSFQQACTAILDAIVARTEAEEAKQAVSAKS
jgi:predicted  nucleic acid-binding Zn-ribbon protein